MKLAAFSLHLGPDQFQADGDGVFDILLDFASGGGTNTRFGAGEAAMYTITYGGGGSFTPGSFDFTSYKDGGQGEYPIVAHVKGIGDFSGWITVPEPTTLCLLGAGAVLLRKRRRR